MTRHRFHHPIEIRYGDLDPQGHVNNAKFLTYFEQARVHYLIQLGLFSNDQSFLDVGIILAEVKVTFLAPVNFGKDIRVGMATTRLGNKSLEMEYRLEEVETGHLLATGTSIQVAFDYRQGQSIPIPQEWRQKIAAFDGLDPTHGDNLETP
ncbi:MAG: thioesterase family protein [Chloroflexota bacterium]